ncbi:hypothetical protein [Parabacteroides faecis]|uniref:hypothetical protein n=1 Tax=Parabacteroides faecis TaxID=1217282 RepID=UPI003522B15E
MNFRNLFTALFAVATLFACSNDDESLVPDAGGPKSISVSLAGMPGIQTRASEAGNFLTKDTINVNSVLINLTDASNSVVVSKTVNKDVAADSDWSKLTGTGEGSGLKFINVPQTVSKVYIYGNPGSAVVDNQVTTTLDQQQGSGVLYSGVDEDLTPIVAEPVEPDPTSGQTYTANVTIKPILARIQINRIYFTDKKEFTFTRLVGGKTEEAKVTWTDFTADLKGIYLNKFFNTYHDSTNVEDLYSNASAVNNIVEGKWLFNQPTPNDAAAYASYNNYSGGAYQTINMVPATGKSYAFNFFPGSVVPTIHLDLTNINVEGMQSTNTTAFNPSLANKARFANIVKYFKAPDVEMTAADFKPGTIYNMEVELIPMLDNDLENIQFNVLVHVTIAPWAEETITPGFDLDQ